MNKQYFVIAYKSGYVIPHYMIYCDKVTETVDSLVLKIDEDHIELRDYDYYHVYEFENDHDVKILVDKIQYFVENLEK
jgi:hypothetical protein